MGTLSQSVKKLKNMEEEIFAMRLHLDNLRIKLKDENLTFGEVTLNVPLSTFDGAERCYICGEIIPTFCPNCGKKIAGTKNIVYGMEKYIDWHCLSCYYKKFQEKEVVSKIMDKIKEVWELDFVICDEPHPMNPTFEAEKYYDVIEKILKKELE